ncbi:hypothetical protein OKW30_004647 [Paraburkholderia sp. Clong3]
MKVRELVTLLADADPESVVLFLDSHADSDGSEEICEVLIPSELWIHEKGYSFGSRYEVRYPGHPRADVDCCDVTHTSEHVVVLSNGPTNLRYYGVFSSRQATTGAHQRGALQPSTGEKSDRYAP